MTSKNLFFKRMKKDLEQRIWIPVVLFILTFLNLEMQLISEIEYWSKRANYASGIADYLEKSFFSYAGPDFFLFTGITAVVSALTGFSYMHSSKKLDVYHSIPIKREKIFFQQYFYGIVYFLIPFLLHVLICIGICAGNGLLSDTVLGNAAGFVAVQILWYLSVYSASVLSVCLTGNLIINVLGCGVLLSYSLVLRVMLKSLMSRFFVTYYISTSELFLISPADLYVSLVQKADTANQLNHMDYLGYFGGFIGMTIVYTVLALLLYRKRQSESAGKSIAFFAAEPVIKTMIVFPTSMCSGILIGSIMTNGQSFGWFFFGCVFGFAIICPLMEIIFRKDVKAVLGHPLQLAFNGALVLAGIMIFQFDIFGYDTYIPDEDKVESYGVVLCDLHQFYYDRYRVLEEMTIQDNDSLRKLLEHGAEVSRKAHKDAEFTASAYSEGDGKEDCNYRNVLVKYRLKSGKALYRVYTVNAAEPQILQCMADTYNDVQYKKAAYPVLSDKREKNYIGLLLDYTYYSEGLRMSPDKMQHFVETYQKELQELTFDELTNSYPAAVLTFACVEPDSADWSDVVQENADSSVEWYDYGSSFEYETTESGYFIHPSFVETLALLEEYGAEAVNEIAPEDVIDIVVEQSFLEDDENNGMNKLVTAEYTAENSRPEKISSILSGFVAEQMREPSVYGNREETDIYVEIHYRHKDKEMRTYGYFVKGKIPSFVKEDLKNNRY